MSEQVITKKDRKKTVIEINRERCTACNICVDMCPANVLDMTDEPSKVAGQIAYVKDLESCTKCMLCEIHCPDFAITVE